jgi:transposase
MAQGGKFVYFRQTTYQQRKLMIDTYLRTGSIKKAVEAAKVSRKTFYNWYKRYKEEGEEGIKEPRSKRPKKLRTVPEEVANKVIEKKKEHSDWGKVRIANELMKENNWQPLISPTGVRNVLIRAGLWNRMVEEEKKEKKGEKGVVAEKPNKTVNVDLFFFARKLQS